MNAGLSHNKCLIGRSCYYPHHFYYYEGTDLRDDGGGQKGPGADWMGEASQAGRDAKASSGRDGEASAGHAEFRRRSGARERLCGSREGYAWKQSPGLKHQLCFS